MPNEVEQIKSRLDVVDVVSEYVKLKQAGQNWKGLCPFHNEKTPSFMVHKEKQIWHCFGCGVGGDIFEFIQKIENVDFPEALELLARKAGVTLESRNRSAEGDSKRLKLFQIAEEAQKFFANQLKSSPQAAAARSYLKQRQLTDESIDTFGVGYSLPEWDKLFVFLRQKNYTPEEIIAAGLALKSERGPGWYDRFRNRLMFPITDVQGRVVGFGGRILDTQNFQASPMDKQAKYINSPQGAIYNKSLVVYNLDRAKQYIKETGFVVLVEGYMDVIGSWQAGVKNVAATSGTALTTEQIKLLKRYTNDIRLAFDADLAGKSASERGVDLALQAELEVKIISLPYGKDPDECAKKDPALWKQAVEQALPIGDHAFKTVLAETDVNTREGKKEAARKLLAAIAKLPDPVERDYYIKRLAQELHTEEKAIREKLMNISPSTPSNNPTAVTTPQLTTNIDRHHLLSERLLVLAFRSVEPWAQIIENIEPEFIAPGLSQDLYKRVIIFYNEHQNFNHDEFQAELSYEPELNHYVGTLLIQGERDFVDFDQESITSEVRVISRELKAHHLNNKRKSISVAIQQAERAGQQVTPEMLEEFASITRALTELNY